MRAARAQEGHRGGQEEGTPHRSAVHRPASAAGPSARRTALDGGPGARGEGAGAREGRGPEGGGEEGRAARVRTVAGLMATGLALPEALLSSGARVMPTSQAAQVRSTLRRRPPGGCAGSAGCARSRRPFRLAVRGLSAEPAPPTDPERHRATLTRAPVPRAACDGRAADARQLCAQLRGLLRDLVPARDRVCPATPSDAGVQAISALNHSALPQRPAPRKSHADHRRLPLPHRLRVRQATQPPCSVADVRSRGVPGDPFALCVCAGTSSGPTPSPSRPRCASPSRWFACPLHFHETSAKTRHTACPISTG
jgi:hypothetical protein